MGQYSIAGLQTVATTAKGTMGVWNPASPLRRIKIYEFDVGATAVPNATDCNITITLSRLVQTSLIVGTAYTPQPTDPGDGAAGSLSNVNITTEPTSTAITTATPEYTNGMNQRNTIRWLAAQESQALIAPATTLNGHYMTVLSPNFASTLASMIYYLE